jgi:hypothetical protein
VTVKSAIQWRVRLRLTSHSIGLEELGVRYRHQMIPLVLRISFLATSSFQTFPWHFAVYYPCFASVREENQQRYHAKTCLLLCGRELLFVSPSSSGVHFVSGLVFPDCTSCTPLLDTVVDGHQGNRNHHLRALRAALDTWIAFFPVFEICQSASAN